MKTLWNILAVVAIGNLVALGAFVGWLKVTDRLDVERATTVRLMLAKTITTERAEKEEAKAKEEAEREAAEAAAKASRAPLTASQLLAAREEATELDRQRIERLQREVSDLRAQLAREIAEVKTQRDQLDADRTQFDAIVRATGEQLQNEQFQKTLGVLVSLKPAQAVTLLRGMMAPPAAFAPVDGGAEPAPVGPAWSEAGITEVVGYLDAMEDKNRTKIIGEFAKAEPALATELLERLRNRATMARVPSGAP
ncbi:hypothetical protein PHYC_02785 [Phycisphaerales bacterium]|nr:hypothetical protein PHYC_02785 [Phycisphaerales bacterium]